MKKNRSIVNETIMQTDIALKTFAVGMNTNRSKRLRKSSRSRFKEFEMKPRVNVVVSVKKSVRRSAQANAVKYVNGDSFKIELVRTLRFSILKIIPITQIKLFMYK